MRQLSLAYSRDSDPESSKLAARRANVGSQRSVILREIYEAEKLWGESAVAVTADKLHARHPQWQRSVISTRLSAMARAGWLRCDRDAVPITFRLSPAGRKAAQILEEQAR